MTRRSLVIRSLSYYWRSNLAVVFGVATAVAVLSGALLVGDSVRGTLKDLALSRLGATDVAVISSGFFREALADDLQRDAAFTAAFTSVAPLVAVEGLVTLQTTGSRAAHVRVYGVDDRFWHFHGVPRGGVLEERQAYVSPALAEDLAAAPGGPLLIRVERPSDTPLESLHGRKDEGGRTIRAVIHSVLQLEELGEFSLAPEQGSIRAVFVPLDRLQAELDIPKRVNTMVVATRAGPESASTLASIVRRLATPEDSGLTLRPIPAQRSLVLGATAGLIDAPRVDVATRAARSTGLRAEPVLTYLANSIRIGSRDVPYSLVTARGDVPALDTRDAPPGAAPPIVLNAWTARDLGARTGDPVELEYYLWEDPGRLVTRSASFRLAAVVPIEAGDRDLAPVYPGITDSPTLDDWNPPFPLDLKRVRTVDEEYWRQYRTTPKAFIRIEDGQRLWGSRYGNLTSLRLTQANGTAAAGDAALDDAGRRYVAALQTEVDPMTLGMTVRDVRADAIRASAGVTDFGQYFIYFSFFIVVSALVLTALFFKLGVEQRVREVGLLGAVGARPGVVRGLFVVEAIVLSIVGGAIGAIGGAGYASIIIHLLRTRWIGAVGTSALTLHVSASSVILGLLGGTFAALVCTVFALRSLRTMSDRALLAGQLPGAGDGRGRGDRGQTAELRGLNPVSRWPPARLAIGAAVFAALLVAAGLTGSIDRAGAFFGAAFFMLVAGLAALSHRYHRPPTGVLGGRGAAALARLGLRNAAARPMRSTLSVAVVAAATFILVSVGAFRKDAITDAGPASGLGGYQLIAESLVPIAHDLSTPAGRQAVGFVDLDDVTIEPFRLRPGDDTSCLNLYQPTNPRILGVRQSFIEAGRFRFRGSSAESEAERANPWRLLSRSFADGAIPVIGDANSLDYVLHKKIGDDIELRVGATTLRLRIVAALSDSLFQRELLMAEPAFVRAFPQEPGYRVLLAEVPPARGASDVGAAIENGLSSFGVDVVTTASRLAEFHRVENTYLATFQMLGGLGLLVGTIGLATVLLRNVLERRRELALFGAVGYRPHHLRVMLLAESLSLLVTGLVIGVATAGVAILPAVLDRGGRVPVSTTALMLLGAVLVSGAMATGLAARAATRQPLIEALRSE